VLEFRIGASLRERDRMQRIGYIIVATLWCIFPCAIAPVVGLFLPRANVLRARRLCAPTVISTPCTGLSLWSIPPSIYIQIPEMTPESGLEKALLDFQIGPPLWLRAYASSYGCSS